MLRVITTTPTALIRRCILPAFRPISAPPCSPHPPSSTSFRAASNESRYEDSTSNPIPVYAAKLGETTDTQRARLVYQSRKRGTLENGLLLSTFAARHLAAFSPAQLQVYDKLINEPSNEWDIYYWMVGTREVPVEYESDVMTLLKEHASNRNNEARICQPALDQ